MTQYNDLALNSLIDLLVVRTKEYDMMLSTKVFSEEEFAQCKLTLAELHAAIKEKAEQEGHPMNSVSPSFPDNKFTYQSQRLKRNSITSPGNKDVDIDL